MSHLSAYSLTLRLLLLAVVLLLHGCATDFNDTPPQGEEIATTATIRSLHTLIHVAPIHIERDIVVSGRVTSSDQAGNFYRSVVIEEEGAALELLVGLDALHNDYPIGAKLYVRLNGLTLGRRLGVLQAGLEADPVSGFEVDYIGSKAAVDQHLVRSAERLLAPTPHSLTISELTPSHCGLLVRIEGLRHIPETEEEIPQWSGYHRFEDAFGAAIYSYVRAYADFAEQPIPNEEGVWIGILQYDASGEGRYLIKPNDANDFQL